MNVKIKAISLVASLLISAVSHADFSLLKDNTPRDVVATWNQVILQDLDRDKQPLDLLQNPVNEQSMNLNMDGSNYFLAPFCHQVKIATSSVGSSYGSTAKNVCSLFVYTYDTVRVGHADLLSNDSNVSANCSKILALSAINFGDGLIVVANCISENSAGGEGKSSIMSFLLKLKKKSANSISIEQDNSCLMFPNKYKTIAFAKKALSQCKD